MSFSTQPTPAAMSSPLRDTVAAIAVAIPSPDDGQRVDILAELLTIPCTLSDPEIAHVLRALPASFWGNDVAGKRDFIVHLITRRTHNYESRHPTQALKELVESTASLSHIPGVSLTVRSRASNVICNLNDLVLCLISHLWHECPRKASVMDALDAFVDGALMRIASPAHGAMDASLPPAPGPSPLHSASSDSTVVARATRIPWKYNNNVLVRVAVRCEIQVPQVVLVVDQSGSKSLGNRPMDKIISFATNLLKQGIHDVPVVAYSHTARVVSLADVATRSKWPLGSTNSCPAFEQLAACIKGLPAGPVSVVFMTYGSASDSPMMPHAYSGMTVSDFKQALCSDAHRHSVTVNTVGIGAKSHLELLDAIKSCGASEGVSLYVEEDGSIADTMRNIFALGANARNGVVTVGEIITEALFVLDQETDTWRADCWVDDAAVRGDSSTVSVSVTISKEEGAAMVGVLTWASDPSSVLEAKLKSFAEEAIYGMTSSEAMRRGHTDGICSKLAGLSKEVSAVAKGDLVLRRLVSKYAALLANIREKLKGSPADFERYAQTFRALGVIEDARRIVLLGRREIQNRKALKGINAKLRALPAVSDVTGELQHACDPELTCLMTMSSLGDILGGDDGQDVMLVALQTTRYKFTMGSPHTLKVLAMPQTCITLVGIRSCVSSSSLPLLSFAEQASVPLVTGPANDPVLSSVLPLYVSPAHWLRIRVWLRVILSLLFVGNETSFSQPQVFALYGVLAQLHSLKKEESVSELADNVLEEFTRAACAFLADDALVLDELEVPKFFHPWALCCAFLDSADGKRIDFIPCLSMIRGVILCAERTSSLGPFPANWNDRWRILAAEGLRRKAAGSCNKVVNWQGIRKIVSGYMAAAANAVPQDVDGVLPFLLTPEETAADLPEATRVISILTGFRYPTNALYREEGLTAAATILPQNPVDQEQAVAAIKSFVEKAKAEDAAAAAAAEAAIEARDGIANILAAPTRAEFHAWVRSYFGGMSSATKVGSADWAALRKAFVAALCPGVSAVNMTGDIRAAWETRRELAVPDAPYKLAQLLTFFRCAEKTKDEKGKEVDDATEEDRVKRLAGSVERHNHVWHVGETHGWWIREIIASDVLLKSQFIPVCNEVTGCDDGRLNWSNWGRQGLCSGGCGSLAERCTCRQYEVSSIERYRPDSSDEEECECKYRYDPYDKWYGCRHRF